MLSVPSTNDQLRSALAAMLCLTSILSFSQINSPYSRYGIGDINPSGNAVNRSIGGLTAAYADFQAVNFLNPATYSHLRLTTFDVGIEIENRTIKTPNKAENYTSGNFAFNYLTIGLPLNKKGTSGLAFGIRPVSKINYKIETRERLNVMQSLTDSIISQYEGSGGSYKLFAGYGHKFGGLSIGANIGFQFGQAEISTRRIFVPDSINTAYYQSNSADNTSFSGFFLETGLHYETIFNKKFQFKIGGTYNLKNNLSASKNIIRETYTGDATTGNVRVDSVSVISNIEGKIKVPQSYTIGASIEKIDKWMIGFQYDAASWNTYSNYNKTDKVANSYTVRVGGQITPKLGSANFFEKLTYRAGAYVGKEYVNVNNTQLPVFAVTLGAGIPIYQRSVYLRQYVTNINLGFEFGNRGNNNAVLKENFFKLHIGFSLSDFSWFQKRRFN